MKYLKLFWDSYLTGIGIGLGLWGVLAIYHWLG